MLWAVLRRYTRPYRGLLATVAGLQAISTLASLYLPTVNAAIIDDGVAQGNLRRIIELGGVMLAVTGLQVVCAIGAVYFGSRAAMGVGRLGRISRIEFARHRSALNYGHLGKPQAEGQLSITQLRRVLQ